MKRTGGVRVHHILQTGYGEYNGQEIKTEVVLPWETPAGTEYETSRLSQEELYNYTEEVWRPASVTPNGSEVDGSLVGDAFAYNIDDWLAAFDIDVEEGGSVGIIREFEIDGVQHVLKFGLTNYRPGRNIHGIYNDGYYTYDKLVKPETNLIKTSNNTTGVNIADEWIDVYYYYSILNFSVEIYNEE